MEEKSNLDYIKAIFEVLNKNFQTSETAVIPFSEIYDMMEDLFNLFNKYFEENPNECSYLACKSYIPLINLMIKIDKERSVEYEKHIKNAFKMGARTNLEYYFVYREWEDKEKYYAPRINILKGYVHYLEEIAKNPNFHTLIANYMSGAGKTYTEKIAEAWNFGYNSTGTVLSLCSNESVVNAGSRTVREEMKSEAFGEVFPELKWSKENKDYFLKETDSEWKLKNCRLGASYIASTTRSNVVGTRASQRIHIDDLYANYKEAMNQNLNEEYFNNYTTVWKKRFVQNKIPKVVITGTLWASGDFIARVIESEKKRQRFKKHPKYPYTLISEDGTTAIIQVPALDYETGLSTAPELISTARLLQEKNEIPEYLFETNFQQLPTNPESMIFAYEKLRVYEINPEQNDDYKLIYAAIDATRKSGKDYFGMGIIRQVQDGDTKNYYFIDCIFKQKATKDMYDEVVEKIIEHHITKLVVESNTAGELKANVERILKSMGYNFCEIIEKYNTENKEIRIATEEGNIRKNIIFPMKGTFGINTDMGAFMNQFTTYSIEGRNAHDDAPDLLSMLCHEIIDGGAKPIKVQVIQRPF